ncbi:hypothetical protein NQZ68_035098 [Dissostichus eleginoides]|nr:hypothetical protein NQZ68_035098 [Dissostichus eleginoides]
MFPTCFFIASLQSQCCDGSQFTAGAVAPPGGGIPGRRARRSGCYGEAFPLRAGAAADSVSQETPLTANRQTMTLRDESLKPRLNP